MPTGVWRSEQLPWIFGGLVSDAEWFPELAYTWVEKYRLKLFTYSLVLACREGPGLTSLPHSSQIRMILVHFKNSNTPSKGKDLATLRGTGLSGWRCCWPLCPCSSPWTSINVRVSELVHDGWGVCCRGAKAAFFLYPSWVHCLEPHKLDDRRQVNKREKVY